MLTKTRLQDIERRWRRFVFDSSFTRVVFAFGIVLFFVAICTPQAIRELLIQRGVMFWFGTFVLYFASAHFLTMLAAFSRRDWLTGSWMVVWTSFITFVACSAFRGVLK